MNGLTGSFALSAAFPLDGQVVTSIPFDRMLKEDGTTLVPPTLVSNAQVQKAEGLETPAQVAEAMKLMFGVNLTFQGYFKRGDQVERNPITGRTQRKTVQTEKLEEKGWMFFASGTRVNGVVTLSDDILAKVRALRK